MAARTKKAGGGDVSRKKAASCSSSGSSNAEDLKFVSQSESDIAREYEVACDQDDTLGSARDWRCLKTRDPPAVYALHYLLRRVSSNEYGAFQYIFPHYSCKH